MMLQVQACAERFARWIVQRKNVIVSEGVFTPCKVDELRQPPRRRGLLISSIDNFQA
jgi:hypothetical protein